uniref:Ras-GEF domain-containing protein n=1 Tax=Globisporangium ultimum (strain ATCC 200006 / CBS 805.95 / DAOM BR144) TaxID=431595 RepID=K3WQB7_GLOUD
MHEIVKEGAVAVRGHFLWRERFVVVKRGEVLIFRRRDGSVKAKISLLDPKHVRVTFHSENSHITLSTSTGKGVIFDCHTTSCRDSWLGALFTARGQLEEEGDTESDVILSGDDSDANESSAVHQHEKTEDGDDEVDDDQYSDALLAFQDVRSSMIQCHLAMSLAKEDLFVAPDASLRSKHHHIHATKSEEALRLACIRSILAFIESSPHGGRVILLHLGVLASAGIKVDDILLALGEKQHETPRRSSLTSSTISLQKLYAATFVRDMLFHPIYSKRLEVQTEHVNAIIDRYFAHCRLRRFSHDDEHMMLMSTVHPISGLELLGAAGGPANPLNGIRPAQPLPSSSIAKIGVPGLKKKRHSFPNILTPLRMKRTGLLDSSKLDEFLKKGCSSSQQQKTTSKNAPGSDEDDVVLLEDNRVTSTSASSFTDTSDLLFHDERSIPAPLQSLLWRNSSCQEIAEQITIFHHHQIARLCLWDFLHNPREASKEISETFNRLVAYFVWSVLVEETSKNRAEAIENIISIALSACSVALNNFHLIMACVGCLGDTPLMVSRMPTTWKRVRPKFKTHLQELRTLCDHTGGFENLRKRQAIMSGKGSCIPFIGVLGVALERLRSIHYFNDRKLLDFDKLEKQYAALNVLENGIQKPYVNIKVSDQMHAFLSSLALEFVTPRLLQLRSQQILVLETAASASSSSLRHTPFLQSSSSSAAGSGSGGDSSDANPALMSFRHICSTLAIVPHTQERIEIGLEALFADERQQLTRQVRKFWGEFKQTVWVSTYHTTVLGVRNCIDTCMRDMMAAKTSELQQISALDENAVELQCFVYEKLVRIVTQPIFMWLMAKTKYTFAAEDKRIAAFIRQNSTHAAQNAESEAQAQRDRHRIGVVDVRGSASSPMELALIVAQCTASASSSTQSSPSELLMRLSSASSYVADQLYSALYVLQQLLAVAYLPQTHRDGIRALDAAIAHIQQVQRD